MRRAHTADKRGFVVPAEHNDVQRLNPSAPPNAMSVDVEDYFQTESMSQAVPRENWEGMSSRVERNTQRLFDLFAAHGVRGTFFFLGWVAERFPGLVKQAASRGHEVACHSYWHRPVFRLTPEEFREDTLRAKGIIEDTAGTAVRGYRAPSFSITPGKEWAADILAELGFWYDSSVHPIRHDFYDNHNAPRLPYHMQGKPLLEIPIATLRLAANNFPMAGGGYFRALPYPCVRWGIRRFNRLEQRPAVFYIHPWEIDPEQPRIAAKTKSVARQYAGLATTWNKLDRLCADFRFVPMVEAFRDELPIAPTVPAAESAQSDPERDRQAGVKSCG
jgi:polysaccharide deacetylase family protein (PEP-CTERM system associated)